MTTGFVPTRIAYSPSAVSNPTNWGLVMAAYGRRYWLVLRLSRSRDSKTGVSGNKVIAFLPPQSLNQPRETSNSILRQTRLIRIPAFKTKWTIAAKPIVLARHGRNDRAQQRPVQQCLQSRISG